MNHLRVLASRSVLAVTHSGERLTVIPTIGFPYEITSEERACPVSLRGLDTQIVDIHGIDAWQVSQLVYELLAQLMAQLIKGGGKLQRPETEEPMLWVLESARRSIPLQFCVRTWHGAARSRKTCNVHGRL